MATYEKHVSVAKSHNENVRIEANIVIGTDRSAQGLRTCVNFPIKARRKEIKNAKHVARNSVL